MIRTAVSSLDVRGGRASPHAQIGVEVLRLRSREQQGQRRLPHALCGVTTRLQRVWCLQASASCMPWGLSQSVPVRHNGHYSVPRYRYRYRCHHGTDNHDFVSNSLLHTRMSKQFSLFLVDSAKHLCSLCLLGASICVSNCSLPAAGVGPLAHARAPTQQASQPASQRQPGQKKS